MKKTFIFLAASVLTTMTVFAQDKNFSKHTVAKGETITQIASKYNITPHDIYTLNPDAQKGLKENDVIIIPASVVKTAASNQTKVADAPKNTSASNRTHTVKAKETFFSIARDYNIQVGDLKNLNAEAFAAGLKVGQTIKIPDAGASVPAPAKPVVAPKPESAVVSNANSEKKIYHIVEAKETKFGIAKKYGITIEELEQRNPGIQSNLPMGYKLVISGVSEEPQPQKPVAEKAPVEKPKPVTTEIVRDEVVTTETVRTLTKNGYANYEVKDGDTMYSLSQYFNISQDELLKLNPNLSGGVKTGTILKVPGRGQIKVSSANSGATKTVDNKKALLPNTTKKQLVLMLPFNAAKIQSDTLKTIDTRLKKDAFLNMTLDFYAGALVAIDSAKTLGLNVDVKILDSEESKTGSSVEALVKNNDLSKADAIIGPFYQQYAEKVADLLKDKNVPVISPMSKEVGKPFPNLYQAMPTTEYGKVAIFEYMKSLNANIIVVSDPKKVANKDFVMTNYPQAKFAALLDNGALDVNDLKSLFEKDKKNFVVLDSERTGLILGTTNVLLNEMSNFSIQLVIMEQNDTLDFEEISMKRLTILKLLYPSFTRENSTPEGLAFENEYKEKNKVFPNQFAVRGFDVTFDTLMRITQYKSFDASVSEVKSEQVESRFQYAKKGKDGNENRGIYLMEYQDDLSVKQVN